VTRPSSASGAVHSMPLRVYYEDTDAAGIVYYANYLKFAERGRTEMMRELGFAHSEIAKEIGTLFTVRRCSIDYRAPARLDDALTVDTRVVEIGACPPDCAPRSSSCPHKAFDCPNDAIKGRHQCNP